MVNENTCGGRPTDRNYDKTSLGGTLQGVLMISKFKGLILSREGQVLKSSEGRHAEHRLLFLLLQQPVAKATGRPQAGCKLTDILRHTSSKPITIYRALDISFYSVENSAHLQICPQYQTFMCFEALWVMRETLQRLGSSAPQLEYFLSHFWVSISLELGLHTQTSALRSPAGRSCGVQLNGDAR